MEYHNYKGLQYELANEQFLKDYKLKYILFGRFKKWNYIPINKLNYAYINNIVCKYGIVYIREKHPLIFYRYLKERIER